MVPRSWRDRLGWIKKRRRAVGRASSTARSANVWCDRTVRRGGNRGRGDRDLTPQRHPDPGHGRVVDRSTGATIGFISRGKPVPTSDARAPKRPPWLDLVTARGERVAPFGLRPGATDPGRPDKACYALQGRPARRVAPSSTGRQRMRTAVAPDASRRTPRGSSRLRMEPPAAFPPCAADSPDC